MDKKAILSEFTIAQMSDAVFWLDESGHFFWVNQAATDLLGYTQTELMRMSVFDINPSMNQALWNKHWANQKLDNQIVETSHRRKDGLMIPVEIANNFVEYEQVTYSCAIIRDMTYRRLEESRFQQTYERLKSSQHQSRLAHFTVLKTIDAVLWINEAGYIKFVNEACCERLGYAYEDLLGMSILDINPNFTLEKLALHFQHIRKVGKIVLESTHQTKSGKQIPVEIASNYIEYEGQAYTCSIVRDITDRKHKEAALRGALMEIRSLKEQLEAENNYLIEEIKINHNFGEIITQSEAFKSVLLDIEQVASTNSTVLVTGESGTGKELIARSIHKLSNRSHRPIIKVNCAALPPNLIESELFGHEKGAFTGAISNKKGRFSLADRGTLFLDEIGEMPLEIQAKLLRVLQEGEFEAVGSVVTQKVDVRVIAATNRNLLEEAEAGNFREDLYYRLNVFPIHCLPLRERKEDIPLLIRHFCRKFESKIGKKITNIPQKVVKQLQAYDFPGNIRELENFVERAIILSRKGKLEIGNWLPKSKTKKLSNQFLPLEAVQKQHIIEVLKHTNWRISGDQGAAKILGLKPTTLESRMKKLGISRSNEVAH